MVMLALHTGLLMTVVAICIQGSLTECRRGDVRLVGPASNEGVVEVCINSNWITICADDSWGWNDATIICRQLGYPYHYYYGSTSRRSRGQESVLSEVQCPIPPAEHFISGCTFEVDAITECSGGRIAYLICRDDNRVQNISAHLVPTASATNVHMVSVNWVQNYSAAEPTSFEVKCQSDFNTITVIVNNKTNSTEQIGLLPESCYRCCVSAVYVYRNVYVYTFREHCTQIATSNLESNTITSASCPMVNNTLDTGLSTTEFYHEASQSDIVSTAVQMSSDSSVQVSNSTSVVGGVLGFLVLLLLVLLIISVVALMCVLRPSERLKDSALYGRLSRLDTTRSTTIPVSNNSSYVTQPPTSRAPRQAVRPANTTAAQPQASATAPNYSSIGPDYESIDPRRQVQMEGGLNRVNMRERYEFAEVHAETDGQNIAQGSMDYEVPVPSASQSEDYSHLQH